MNLTFAALGTEHQSAVMEIFNYYVQTGTAAFPAQPLPEPFFAMLLKKSEGGYPAYAVLDEEKVIGFCQLSPHSPFSSFSKTADCTYFLSPEYTGRGIGGQCLSRLIAEGRNMGIRHFVASISSENTASLRFHESQGFRRVGELSDIGEKLGRSFGVVLMQKDI
ncbi:MAG: GNAT family N-acetyltransferase [Oscillospiraceae bacterium]